MPLCRCRAAGCGSNPNGIMIKLRKWKAHQREDILSRDTPSDSLTSVIIPSGEYSIDKDKGSTSQIGPTDRDHFNPATPSKTPQNKNPDSNRIGLLSSSQSESVTQGRSIPVQGAGMSQDDGPRTTLSASTTKVRLLTYSELLHTLRTYSLLSLPPQTCLSPPPQKILTPLLSKPRTPLLFRLQQMGPSSVFNRV